MLHNRHQELYNHCHKVILGLNTRLCLLLLSHMTSYNSYFYPLSQKGIPLSSPFSLVSSALLYNLIGTNLPHKHELGFMPCNRQALSFICISTDTKHFYSVSVPQRCLFCFILLFLAQLYLSKFSPLKFYI